MTTKSTPQTAHTPTPWCASDAPDGSGIPGWNIAGADGWPICCMMDVNQATRARNVPNAEFIVRAVNHHEALLAALRGLLDDVEGYGLKHPDAEDQSFEPESANAARAVLAQVEQPEKGAAG